MTRIRQTTLNLIREIDRKTMQKHLLLFFLTLASTTLTGYYMAGPSETPWFDGLLYSVPVMVILGAHELGHYVAARLYGVDATLPYFIPLPVISPFGTLGAFIKMKEMPPDRRSLFDIAFWGPAMSFLFSIPFMIGGLMLSEVRKVPENFGGMVFGDSLLFRLTAELFYEIPAGYDVFIHPMAFAAWAGLFVTAINLLPIGQLDGGHIAYSVFGKRARQINYLFVAVLIILSFEFFGWAFWVMLLFLMGIHHPPLNTEGSSPLDKKRMRMAFYSAVMLILCFIPVPLDVKLDKPEERAVPEGEPFHDTEQWNVEQRNIPWKLST